jgi:hypothetical protein
MESLRRITEEDLRVTESLIAQSYSDLKQSVIQDPFGVCKTVGKTVRNHPFATAATAVVAGVAVYGIFQLMTSRAPAKEAQQKSRVPRQKDSDYSDLIREMVPMIIPIVAPYITVYLQKYAEKIQSD